MTIDEMTEAFAGHRKKDAVLREIDHGAYQAKLSEINGRLLTTRGARRRDIVVETINGAAAGASPFVQAFLDAGFRRQPGGLRYYAGGN